MYVIDNDRLSNMINGNVTGLQDGRSFGFFD